MTANLVALRRHGVSVTSARTGKKVKVVLKEPVPDPYKTYPVIRPVDMVEGTFIDAVRVVAASRHFPVQPDKDMLLRAVASAVVSVVKRVASRRALVEAMIVIDDTTMPAKMIAKPIEIPYYPATYHEEM